VNYVTFNEVSVSFEIKKGYLVKTQYHDGAPRIYWIRSAVSARIVNNRIICAQLANSILVFTALISVRETGRPNLPTGFIKSASRSARNLVVAHLIS